MPSLVALNSRTTKACNRPRPWARSARAGAGVAAFLIGGVLGTFIGWRPAFGILIVLSAVVLALSFRLKPGRGRPDVGIDIVGVLLAWMSHTRSERSGVHPAVIGHLIGVCDQVGRLPDEVRGTRE